MRTAGMVAFALLLVVPMTLMGQVAQSSWAYTTARTVRATRALQVAHSSQKAAKPQSATKRKESEHVVPNATAAKATSKKR